MTVVFTTISSVINGIFILIVLFSKQLRSQPYQWLLANYLLSSIVLMFGFGFYRIVQIQSYKYDGFIKSSEETNCGIAKFFEFPLMASNFCLFLLGFERYILLKYTRTVDWFTLLLFLVLPWTISIYRYSFELVSPKERYLNIPYVGLCIDISSEGEKRRNLYTVLNVAVPLFLALITTILAYYKTFAVYKNASVFLRRKSFSDINEEAFLLYRKKFIKKFILRLINLATILLGLRVAVTITTSSLFSQFSKDDLSQDYRDRVGIIGIVIIYLETITIPIICLVFNRLLQEILINIVFKIIPWYRRASAGNDVGNDVINEENL